MLIVCSGSLCRHRDQDRFRSARALFLRVLRLTTATSALLGMFHLVSARAETLDEAMSWALRSSFSTRSDNARQDAATAKLRGSIDAFMPTIAFVQERIISSKINYSPDITVPDASGLNTTPTQEPNAYGFQASLPLFDGFRRYNNVRAARLGVDAGRYLKLDRRQQVLLDTAGAYLAVIRDRKIVELRKKQLEDLSKIAARTEARFSVRDTTLADVYISKSRVVAAETALEQSASDLTASNVEYQRLTGAEPGNLPEPQSPDSLIPASVEEFQKCLVQSNPKLQAARIDATAAGYVAQAAQAEIFPQVNLVASHMQQNDISEALNRATDTTVKVQLRVPLYEPGAQARISEASATARQKSWDAADNQKQGVATATTLYLRRLSIIAQIERTNVRVKSMQKAVESYRIEQSAGFKTIIDTLNARQELTEAQIARVNMEFTRDNETFALAASLARLGSPQPAFGSGTSLLQTAGLMR